MFLTPHCLTEGLLVSLTETDCARGCTANMSADLLADIG